MKDWTRRRFFLASLASGLVAGVSRLMGTSEAKAAQGPVEAGVVSQGQRPLMVSSANGLRALDRGMAILQQGGDPLDAVLATVNVVEDDPNDTSVGYGGLPNEDGAVELDASVMHGPTRRAGAVASLREIKNPSRVARLVMERTDHVLLVGAGALRFAEAHGFERQNLLTERARTAWLAWKESMSDRDSWGPGLDSPEWRERTAQLLPAGLSDAEREEWLAWIREVVLHPPTGTINCLAVDGRGNLAGTTTTSGLAWKIAGRVGDSPLIGAGLYVDNDVGAAGSTGRGEECIKVNGAHTVVEMMRQGKTPTEACLEALHRVARNYGNDRARLRRFHLLFYALNKDGVHGGASLWGAARGGRPRQYAVHDGTAARLVDCAALLEGAEA
ncbi:MAG: N(4)-(beta-N-acetylglucosaminyl)-L-asparaginase [Firmicutes bacterium]|nr:N(4)-(beta-N-acetylglucosaminyl)-L-asparaginase [Bacillota bacterium]